MNIKEINLIFIITFMYSIIQIPSYAESLPTSDKNNEKFSIASLTPDYFNNLKLGQTLEDILNYEKLKNAKVFFNLRFDLHLLNTFDYSVGRCQDFYFYDKNDKTNCVMINIVNDYTNSKSLLLKHTKIKYVKYITEYENIDETLKKIYGNPTNESFFSKDVNIQEYSLRTIKAIIDGEAYYKTYWEKEDYTVTHILGSHLERKGLDKELDNYVTIMPIAHIILVKSKDF